MSVQFALIAAQMYLSIITQKRPKKMTFQDLLDSNKGDETRPIPYIRGRWKTKPQRIWLGDFSARAVERDSVWTDYVFFGPVLATLLDTITVGYRYYVGQGFALTWGPINRVHQVYVQDLPCAVAPTVDNAGGSLLLDDPSLFGGDQPPGGGGVYGVCDVIAGNYTQGRNAYLASVEGNVPALHGVAALIIRGRSGFTESGYFAANALELREWQVELMAWPDVLNTGDAQLPDQSYNRIHSMYEWATAADYGAEYPAANIHLPSWRAAAATCYDDGLGFSGEINTGGNVGEVFDQLRASVDAEVYEHPRDGLKIKLIRKDYSLPTVKVLDESNVSTVDEYTPGDNADTFNRVTLNYINAANNYQPRPAVYEDPANFHLQRRVSSRELSYPGVASPTLAQKLVTRDGRALAQPFPPLNLTANDDGEELWPGEVYHFQWRDPLVRKVFRVHSRTPGVSYDGERNFKLTSTEDQYSIGMSVFGAPAGTDATNPADIWATAPPSAAWDSVAIPANGLRMDITTGLSGELESFITGAIEFGVYGGGQYARIYLTYTPVGGPAGTQTLTPLKLSPDTDNKAQFTWPSLTAGTYEFCVQTYSLTGATNGVKVCADTVAASFSVSPSASESPSDSASPSPSSSESPSASASTSPSSSTSPSLSPSASVSASQSPSSSASPSSSQSPSASVSPSSSTSPSSSISASVSPSSSVSPSPAPIPAVLELRADAGLSGLSDGDPITTWLDQSGNARHGTGVADGGVSKPIFKQTGGPGGRPCVQFLGDTLNAFNRTGFSLASSIPVSNYTILAVVKAASGSSPYTITGGGGGCFQYRIDPLKQNAVRENQANLGSSSTDLSTAVFQFIAVTYDGTTLQFYLSGVGDGTVTIASTQTNPISNVFGWNGASFSDREEYIGDACMIKICDFILNPTELVSERADVLADWGV
jgi:hypothetical protein